MHPDLPTVIRDHHFRRPFRRVPILFHDKVAADGQLATLTYGNDPGSVDGINDLGFHVRHQSPNAVNSFIHWIVCSCHS